MFSFPSCHASYRLLRVQADTDLSRGRGMLQYLEKFRKIINWKSSYICIQESCSVNINEWTTIFEFYKELWYPHSVLIGALSERYWPTILKVRVRDRVRVSRRRFSVRVSLVDRRNSGNSTYATVNFRIDLVGDTFRLTDSWTNLMTTTTMNSTVTAAAAYRGVCPRFDDDGGSQLADGTVSTPSS